MRKNDSHHFLVIFKSVGCRLNITLNGGPTPKPYPNKSFFASNLRSLDLIKQYCKSERIKGLMIGVDAGKPFDSVDHNCMQGVLEALGSAQNVKTGFLRVKLFSVNINKHQ